MTLAGLHPTWTAVALAAARLEPPKGLTGVLPGELAEPLHFPDPGLARWPILALLAIAVAWALYRRWHRRRPRKTSKPTKPTPTPKPHAEPQAPRAPTFGQILYSLQQRILTSRAYRAGCHELATLLKGHFEKEGLGSVKRVRCSRMTAREIDRAAGHGAASALLVQLSDLRFGRGEPSRGEFEQVCRRAQQVTGRKARRRRLVTESEADG